MSQNKAMKDDAIEYQLNLDLSEFEDDEDNDDIDDVDYRPQDPNRQSDNSAETSSDSEDELSVPNSPASSNFSVTGGRSLQRRGGRRVQGISSISRQSSRRISSSRGRVYHQTEAADNGDIGSYDGQTGGWTEKDFNPDIIHIMQTSYLSLNDQAFS